MAAINLIVRVKASAEDTYRALTTNEGIAGWFTETQCAQWSESSSVTWLGNIYLRIAGLEENRLVEFTVDRGGGWENTQISFAIEQTPEHCKILFDHRDWPQVSEHFRDCAMSWAYFLESLRSYLETGKGTPEGVAPACEST